jgi:hypothetical protein
VAILSNSVPSNYEVLQATQQLVKTLNATPGWCRLFKNNFGPTPATLRTDFVEADFTGYTPFDLTGAFPDPSKQIDGFYSSASAEISFANSGGSSQTIYGWWVSAGSNWYWSGLFDAPVVMAPSSTLSFFLTWQGVNLGLLLP